MHRLRLLEIPETLDPKLLCLQSFIHSQKLQVDIFFADVCVIRKTNRKVIHYSLTILIIFER